MTHLNFRDGKDYLNQRLNEVKNSYPILENGNIAVDIGSNVGAFPLVNHSKFKKIFCFEPSYHSYHQILNNLKNNQISNVEVYNLGLSDKSGQILQLRKHISNLSGCASTVISEKFGWNNTEEYESVLSINLPDLYQLLQIEYIDYLKIDCEGSEHLILIDQDLSKIKYLAIELHVQLEEKMLEVRQYLEKYFTKVREKGDGIKNHFEILYKQK